jgi:hypothetical protein
VTKLDGLKFKLAVAADCRSACANRAPPVPGPLDTATLRRERNHRATPPRRSPFPAAMGRDAEQRDFYKLTLKRISRSR